MYIYSSTIYKSQDMEANQVHTLSLIHNEILLSHKKKNEILPCAATWMDLENIILSVVSQREKQI